MPENPYLEQAKKNVIGLIKDKKFKTAYNFCKEILYRFPEEKEFIKLQEQIEKEVDKQNNNVIEDALKELDPLWDTKKYFEILKGLKPLFQLSADNSKLIKVYEKAQKLYKEQSEEQEKKFKKEEEGKFDKLLKENTDQLIQELKLLEQHYPKNQKFQELIKKYRTKIIHKKISEKSDLLSSDKFEDISSFFGILKNIDRNSEEVERLEKETMNRFGKNKIDKKTEFLYQSGDQVITLIKLKKYDKAIKACNEILEIDSGNKQIKRLLAKAERAYFKQSRDKSIDVIISNLDTLKKEYKQNKKGFVRI